MEQDQLTRLEAKMDQVLVSVEKMRKYLLWTFIASIAFFVLPLIALIVVIPVFLSSYLGSLQSLGL